MKRLYGAVAEIAAAYLIVGIVYYLNDTEFRMRTLDVTSRACWDVARAFGRLGIRAECEYHRIAESERMN